MPDALAARVLLDAGIRDGIHLVGDRAPHPYAPGRDREQRNPPQPCSAAGVELAGALDCAWEPEAAYDAVTAALQAAFDRPHSSA